ncbi:hypothetical protein TNCV_835041 [Trichonephila clavipes]|nr:hypothetical protein TNCV_835041 [Trichonephila clavipes]
MSRTCTTHSCVPIAYRIHLSPRLEKGGEEVKSRAWGDADAEDEYKVQFTQQQQQQTIANGAVPRISYNVTIGEKNHA